MLFEVHLAVVTSSLCSELTYLVLPAHCLEERLGRTVQFPLLQALLLAGDLLESSYSA